MRRETIGDLVAFLAVAEQMAAERPINRIIEPSTGSRCGSHGVSALLVARAPTLPRGSRWGSQGRLAAAVHWPPTLTRGEVGGEATAPSVPCVDIG